MTTKNLAVVVPSDGELWWRHGTGFRVDDSPADELFLYSTSGRDSAAFYRLYGSADDMEGTAGTASFALVDWGVPHDYTLGDVVDGKWTRAAAAGETAKLLTRQVEIYRKRVESKMEALLCKLSGLALFGRPDQMRWVDKYLGAEGAMKQPTQHEVLMYVSGCERAQDVVATATAFFNWAEARGWMISYGVPMTDWKAEFHKWWEAAGASNATH